MSKYAGVLVLVASIIAILPAVWEARLRRRAGRMNKAPRTAHFRDMGDLEATIRAGGREHAPRPSATGTLTPLLLGDGPLLVVLPGQERVGGGGLAVPLEDVRATEEISQLVRASAPHVEPEIHVVPEGAETRDPREENLILIGSPFVNRLTARLLQDEGLSSKLSFRFVYAQGEYGRPAKRLVSEEEVIASPYGEQIARHQRDPGNYSGGFDDYGVVCRVRSPWNPDKRILVVAGIRALGTWGAAWFLNREAAELLRRAGDADFKAVVRVHLEQQGKVWLRTELQHWIAVRDSGEVIERIA